MRSDIVPGAVFPDYELSDHTAKGNMKDLFNSIASSRLAIAG